MSGREIQIVEIATNEVVKRFDVSDYHAGKIDRLFDGLLDRTNLEHYDVICVDVDEAKPSQAV